MDCKIIKKSEIADGIFDFTVENPNLAQKAKPGQFVHVLCGGNSYLRRPISICEIVSDKAIRFIFRVKGEGTESLSAANVGDTIDVLGPLGNGFTLNNSSDKIALVGGGIGVFPLLELAKRYGKSANVFLGFRDEKSVMMDDDFSQYTDKVFVATEDGSCGFKGYVTDLLRNILSANKIDIIYCCGPMVMMKAVADVAADFGVKAQVSLEERMGCGIGACVTCTCNINGGKKRVCKDGPVFDATEVEWDA